MANFVYPGSDVVGNVDGVNLDNVISLKRDYYVDKEDKSLNRYYINYTMVDKSVVQWAYRTYESRDEVYTEVQEAAIEVGLDLSSLEVSLESLISLMSVQTRASNSLLNNILEELQVQTKFLRKIYNPE